MTPPYSEYSNILRKQNLLSLDTTNNETLISIPSKKEVTNYV